MNKATQRPVKTVKMMLVQSSSEYSGYPNSTGQTTYSLEVYNPQELAIYQTFNLETPWTGWVVCQAKNGGIEKPTEFNPQAPEVVLNWAKNNF